MEFLKIRIFLLFTVILINPGFGTLVRLDVGEKLTNLENSSSLSFDLGEFQSRSILLQIYAESPFPSDERDIVLNILAPEYHRLLGFVKSAHLRVLWVPKKDTLETDGQPDFFPECLDYISINGLEMICHDVSSQDIRIYPPTLIGPRSFRGGVGERLELQIHTQPFPNNKKTTGIRHLAEIAITAYAECPEDAELGDIGSGLSRCSQDEDFSCIPSHLICDSEVHCLFPDAIGEDEKGCGDEEEYVDGQNGTWTEETNDSGQEPTFLFNVPWNESTTRDRWNRRHGRMRNKHGKPGGGRVLVKKKDIEESPTIRNYFLPTAAIFFLIWGVVTLFRKCYKCYRSEYGKEEAYYY